MIAVNLGPISIIDYLGIETIKRKKTPSAEFFFHISHPSQRVHSQRIRKCDHIHVCDDTGN